MNLDNLTGWDLLFPRHPLQVIVWLLAGLMLGWMIRSLMIRRK